MSFDPPSVRLNLPDGEIPGIVDTASIVLQILSVFPRLWLPSQVDTLVGGEYNKPTVLVCCIVR